MKFIAFLLLSLLGVSAQAACSPAAPTAVRTGYFSGEPSAFWAYWYCTDTGKVTIEIRVLPTAAVTPAILNRVRAYVSGSDPAFATLAPTLLPTDPGIAPAYADALSAALADPGKPTSAAVVWKSVGTGTLYNSAAGKLTSVITGRKVPLGTVVDCTAAIIVGVATYCPVVGASPSEVTLARKASP